MSGLAAPDAPVLRLTVLWREVVVDSFAVGGDGPATQELRVGGSLQAAWDDEVAAVVLTLDGAEMALVKPGESATLGGLTVLCRHDALHPAAHRPLFFDGRWLQALLIAAAVQVCVVSALLLTPRPVVDPEPGAGLTMADVERFLAVPAGGAPREGRATFAPTGERPEEGERVSHERPPLQVNRDRVATVRWSSTPAFLAESLDKLLGDEGGTSDLARVLGDDALATARSEQASAGVGGLLSPRPLVEPGAGNGTVGIGESQTQKVLDANEERLEKQLSKKEPLRKPKPEPKRAPQAKTVFPVTTTRVPEGDVSIDPIVKDFLATRVREHKNSIRYCYETFGLAGDPTRQGRLVLELTLLPDGHVTDVTATTTEPGLTAVATCVQEQASQWFLGDVLPDEPKRLKFPFQLRPKRAGHHVVFGHP